MESNSPLLTMIFTSRSLKYPFGHQRDLVFVGDVGIRKNDRTPIATALISEDRRSATNK